MLHLSLAVGVWGYLGTVDRPMAYLLPAKITPLSKKSTFLVRREPWSFRAFFRSTANVIEYMFRTVRVET